MLLREFLEEDMINFLDGVSSTVKDNSAAEEAEIQDTLKAQEKKKKEEAGAGVGDGSGKAGDGKPGVNVTAKGSDDDKNAKESSPSINIQVEAKAPQEVAFKPPRELKIEAPQIVAPNIVISSDGSMESATASTTPSADGQSPSGEKSDQAPVIQDENVFKHPTHPKSQPVADSSSLRNIIREELSGLSDRPYDQPISSPSELRQAIRDELGSVISSGRIGGTRSEETLRGIVHDELAKIGGIDNRKRYTPERIHVDETLLTGESITKEDLEVTEIMHKDPSKRTRREELSMLGKLEDYLVDLKIAIRNGQHSLAVHKYRSLKQEASTLRHFPQERHFILGQLHLISQDLFFSVRKKAGIKKMIVNKKTGEAMDPLDFGNEDFSQDKKQVYHIALDKTGDQSVVDPSNRSLVVERDIFGTQVKTLNDTHEPISFVKETPHDDHLPFIADKDSNVFYLLQKHGENGASLVYHKNLAKDRGYQLFADHLDFSHDSLAEIKNKIEDKIALAQGTGDYFVQSKQNNETQEIERKNPEHTKSYLQALQAIRLQDKDKAISILTDLHQKYPNNLAIKVRLKDALEL